MMYKLIAPGVIIAALAGVSPARAQQPADTGRVHTLDSLVVTAGPKMVQEAAPPVSTITVTPAVLRRTQASDPWDLLRRTTDIEIHEQGQGPGFASNAVLRGFSSDHSSDALLVLDGVPINLPIHGHVEGYNDWSMLTAPAVGSLRVVNGPASPLYGDFNFGGVVEVNTPTDITQASSQLSVTSFGDVAGWIRTGRLSPTSGFFVSALGEREQGWRDNSSYWLGSGSVRGWHQVGSKGRLEGGLLLYGSDWNSPGYLTIAEYNADDLTPATNPTDGGDAQRIIGTAKYSVVLSPTSGLAVSGWVQGVRTHLYLTLPDDGVLQQEDELDRRVAFGTQALMSWNIPAGEFTLGISGRLDLSKYNLLDTDDRVPTDTTTLNNGQYISGSVFGRWQKFLWSRVAMDLGARLDVLDYGSQNLLTPGSPMIHAVDYEISPKLGARYVLSGNAALLASVSRGFRGAPGVVTNPLLPPITMWAYELGTQLNVGPVAAYFALFLMNVQNEIIQDPITLDQVNTGASTRRGVSARVSWQANPRLLFQANGTWNNATIREVASNNSITIPEQLVTGSTQLDPTIMYHTVPPQPGDWVPGVAEYNLSLGGEYRIGARGGAGARVRFGGPFAPLGEPDVRTQPYVLLDVGGQVPIGRTGPVLDIALQNVFNTKFPEIRSSGYINPGAPIALRVAVSFAVAQ